jgi:hypothetical protein
MVIDTRSPVGKRDGVISGSSELNEYFPGHRSHFGVQLSLYFLDLAIHHVLIAGVQWIKTKR